MSDYMIEAVFPVLYYHTVISADPCEYYDLSRTEPRLLATMLNRLKAYRATAVDANFTHTVDGSACPEVSANVLQTPRVPPSFLPFFLG